MKGISLLLAALTIGAFAGLARAEEQSVIANGTFETANAEGDWPENWPKPDGGTWEQEAGNHFLRMKVTTPGKATMVYMLIPVKDGPRHYELSYRVRYADIKPGAQPWFDGRIMMNFKDADKKVVKGAPGAPAFRGSSSGWVSKSLRINVPEGADSLEMMFTLFQAQSGTLEFDDVKLVPVAAPTTVPAK